MGDYGEPEPTGSETFTYDLLGRLATHGTALGTFNYGYLGNSGQVTNRSVTNGTRTLATTTGYDTNTNDRRLKSITHSGAARSYTITSNPYQITRIAETASLGHPLSSQTKTFTYDGSDRLLTGTATVTGNSTYRYDKLDNLTQRVEGGVTNNPTYNNLNQLTAFTTGQSWSYDANGNVVSDTKRTYQWDAEDRATQLTFAGNSNRMSYLYDGLGRRLKGISTVNGVTTETRYLWCGSRLCQVRDGQDNVTTRVYGEGEYQTTGAKKYVYLTDQLGSVRDVVDASTGSLVGSLDYRPYGQIRRQSGSVSPLYQFAQLPWDGNAGLSVSPTRFYDAGVARWMSRDPIREAGGINLYAYVGGSPLSLIDPDGQVPLLIPLAAAAAAELAPYVIVGGAAAGLIWNNAFPPSRPVPVPIYPAKPNNPSKPKGGDEGCEKAPESYAKNLGNQIEKALGKKARREFHDLDHLADRSKDQLREDARQIFEDYGKEIPPGLR